MRNARILIVDDEKMVRRTISRVLGSQGMSTMEADNGGTAIRLAQSQHFDLIILDIIMDGMDGFQVVRQLRDLGILTPVFILSGRMADNDKVLALGIGADDYITKPFSPSVLCAKVKACLRRIELSGQGSENILAAGPFRYICDEMRLQKDGTDILLSSKESFLMKCFLLNLNKVLTKEQIYSYIWGNNIVDDNTIMVHIRRLRIKIEDDPNQPVYLKTVRGVGYQFTVIQETEQTKPEK